MNKMNRYESVALLNELQRRAGVDTSVRELVVAHARLTLDQGAQPCLAPPSVDAVEVDHLVQKWLDYMEPLDSTFETFLFSVAGHMRDVGVTPILSIQHLAWQWGMSSKRLWWYASHTDRCYRRHSVPKKRGGFRQIDAPTFELKTRQRWIVDHCVPDGCIHDAAKGFRKNYSIRDNALPHVGKQVVIRIDLQDFFPTITHRQVRKAFENVGYPYRVAVALACICTLRGRLPQGSPASPVLSNLVCAGLDRRLTGAAKRHRFDYTRYADDMTFSSNRRDLPSLIPFLQRIIEDEGFRVHAEKTSVMRPSARQIVTGLTVNKNVHVGRKQRRILRSMAHRQKLGIGSRESKARLEGSVSFVRSISRSHADQLVKRAGHG